MLTPRASSVLLALVKISRSKQRQRLYTRRQRLADLTGQSKPTITVALRELQSAGFITYKIKTDTKPDGTPIGKSFLIKLVARKLQKEFGFFIAESKKNTPHEKRFFIAESKKNLPHAKPVLIAESKKNTPSFLKEGGNGSATLCRPPFVPPWAKGADQ